MNFAPPSPFIAGSVSLLLIVGSMLLGFRIAKLRPGDNSATSTPLGSVIAAVLGLLAFTLAFTFNIAAERYDARKKLVLEEANALGTLYLRASLLDDAFKDESTALIKEYIEIRAENSTRPEMIPHILKESTRIHDALWAIAVRIAKESSREEIAALYIRALNDVIDLHSSRVTLRLHTRIPPFVWIVLTLITALSMFGVGVQYGASGSLSWIATVILALSFSGVVMLIADLDNQAAGFLRVHQTPIEDLYESIAHAPSPT